MTEKPWSKSGKAGNEMCKGSTAHGISKEALCAEYEAVYRYVLSLCCDDTKAQDITQETFLKAMTACLP